MSKMEKELNYGQFVTRDGNVFQKNIRLKTLNYSSADSDVRLATSAVSPDFVSDALHQDLKKLQPALINFI